jgi:hypothetical protein
MVLRELAQVPAVEERPAAGRVGVDGDDAWGTPAWAAAWTVRRLPRAEVGLWNCRHGFLRSRRKRRRRGEGRIGRVLLTGVGAGGD